MGRETTRRREQRAAAYSVAVGTACRRQLAPDEAQALFHAIDRKDAARFGIRKLSSLELDALHEAPPCIPWERRITLLYYAAWRRRDHFIIALLRAGADPGVREANTVPLQRLPSNLVDSSGAQDTCTQEACSSRGGGSNSDGECQALDAVPASRAAASTARAFVAGLRPALAAWVVRAVVRLRHAGAKVCAMQTGQGAEFAGKCVECDCLEVHQPVAWTPCSHVCCEPCLWQRASRLGAVIGAELRCPCCGTSIPDPCTLGSSVGDMNGQSHPRPEGEGTRSDWDCSSCGYVNFARRAECRNCGASRSLKPLTDCGEAAAAAASALDSDASAPEGAPTVPGGSEERKAASRLKWEALPLHEEPQARGKAERFRALDPEAAAAAFLGKTRSDRTSELLKAATSGDALRLAAIFEAGADLDAKNEYGQTALFLAAYHGHAEAVHLLLKAGASEASQANGGSTPAITAAANGHTAVVQVLSHCGVRLHESDQRAMLHEPLQAADVEAELPGLRHATVTVLVDALDPGAGAGSCYVDHAFPEAFLRRLERLFGSLPAAEQTKDSPSDRSYFCDSENWIRRAFAEVEHMGPSLLPVDTPMAQMRFLHYVRPGGGLPPHVDLARTSIDGHRSSHTFILYLTDCSTGGETVLLKRMEDAKDAVLRTIQPRRGRLLIFPHQCPHLARPTVEVPKLLLRGEMYKRTGQ